MKHSTEWRDKVACTHSKMNWTSYHSNLSHFILRKADYKHKTLMEVNGERDVYNKFQSHAISYTILVSSTVPRVDSLGKTTSSHHTMAPPVSVNLTKREKKMWRKERGHETNLPNVLRCVLLSSSLTSHYHHHQCNQHSYRHHYPKNFSLSMTRTKYNTTRTLWQLPLIIIKH